MHPVSGSWYITLWILSHIGSKLLTLPKWHFLDKFLWWHFSLSDYRLCQKVSEKPLEQMLRNSIKFKSVQTNKHADRPIANKYFDLEILKLTSAISIKVLLFHQMIALQKLRKCSLRSRDIQSFVFLSFSLFLPVGYCFRAWSKVNLKVHDVINCLKKVMKLKPCP